MVLKLIERDAFTHQQKVVCVGAIETRENSWAKVLQGWPTED